MTLNMPSRQQVSTQSVVVRYLDNLDSTGNSMQASQECEFNNLTETRCVGVMLK